MSSSLMGMHISNIFFYVKEPISKFIGNKNQAENFKRGLSIYHYCFALKQVRRAYL